MRTIEQRLLSGNFSPGRSHPVRAIVLHLMAGTIEGTDAWFRKPEAKASAHYGVGRDGRIVQWVRTSNTAWHAGRVHKATWPDLLPGVSPNRYTIGIEHEGRVEDDWPDAMVDASAWLVALLMARFDIAPLAVNLPDHTTINALHSCPGPRSRTDRIRSLALGRVAGTG